MSFAKQMVEKSIRHPRALTWVMVLISLVLIVLAGLPSVVPGGLGFFKPIQVDTDPENMLSADEPARVFHRQMKERLSLYDMVVVGVVNETDPDGVFNPQSLKKVYQLVDYAKGLNGERIGEAAGEGVIPKDIMSLSTVDSIEPTSAGVRFQRLMPVPPADREQSLDVLRRAKRVPMLDGTIISDAPGKEGKAVAIYLPLSRKDLSHKIYKLIEKKASQLGGPERYYITGLPVAEDTFGVEMFIQMAISAPAAMLVIFILMLVFFRKLVMIISPLIVAMVSVIFTMGTLIIAGFPVHIMSSMIPIFIMPIAVLDSIHIISEFFEKYQATRDRAKTIRSVMDELFMPMLYTSLTSAAGFASLALTPIPPVQVFGVFVAVGIMFAWLLTITFIPAYVMLIPPKSLENFGAVHDHDEGRTKATAMSRFLHWTGGVTVRRAKPILALAMVVMVIAAWGMSRINVNDNPVKWFAKSHSIRVADKVLNSYFGGTYMAYLAVDVPSEPWNSEKFVREFSDEVNTQAAELKDNPQIKTVSDALVKQTAEISAKAASRSDVLVELSKFVDGKLHGTSKETKPVESSGNLPSFPQGMGGDPEFPSGLAVESEESKPATEIDYLTRQAWDSMGLIVSNFAQRQEIFKRPDVLNYLVRLQNAANASSVVGKSSSLADIVRTVYRDFISGEPQDYAIPAARQTVGEMLVQFQSSNRKDDLWHFVTPDFRTTSLWLQLNSGDNKDMSRVVADVQEFTKANKPPVQMDFNWFGLTYINVKWQEKMVWGMMEAFTGSFLVVFLLMTVLFRSALWGFLSMIPLTITIAAIYGAVGIVGKDYDMPVAVLSSLTLGLAVDFAIHFLARSRAFYGAAGTNARWKDISGEVFGEPARAIMRNIIVIAAGFLPLLLAPLVPYNTVGILLATILFTSGAATLLLLPALMGVLEKPLFSPGGKAGMACNCATCIISAAALAGLVVVNGYRYLSLGVNKLVILSAAVIIVSIVICRLMSRREKCKIQPDVEEKIS